MRDLNYWDENEEYPIADWQFEVNNGDTRQGYHDWIWYQQSMQDEDVYDNDADLHDEDGNPLLETMYDDE